MSNRFGRWVRLYWPTFVYLGVLCAVYCGLLYAFMTWLWPDALRNGEPVAAGLANNAQELLREKLSFQTAVKGAYLLLGGTALALYLFYCFSGRLAMPPRAHVAFAKTLRVSTVFAFLALMLNVCAGKFVISTHADWWDSGKRVLIWLSVCGCGYWFLKTLLGLLKKETLAGIANRWKPAVYLLLALLLFTLVSFGDDLLVLAVNTAADVLKPDAQPVLADTYRFVITLPVDFLLPLFMLVPLAMFLLATRYASPVSVSTPPGGGLYALVASGVKPERRYGK